MTAEAQQGKIPTKPEPEAIKFDADSLESILDLAYVGDKVSSKLYNQLAAFVDERSLTGELFELEMTKAKDNWAAARGVSVPSNSTFRSAVSTIRGALANSISLFDTDGVLLGKTALGKQVKEAVTTTGSDLDKRFKTINTQFANLLAASPPAKQEEYAKGMAESLKIIFDKLNGS